MLNIFETEAQLEGSLKGREKERTERESSRGGVKRARWLLKKETKKEARMY